MNLRLNRECVEKLVSECRDNELYAAIIDAQERESLDDCLVTEWSQHWPVIDGNLKLTGKFIDSEDNGDWLNYDDRAMISREDAVASDWDIDDDEGRAAPSEKE